MTDAERAKEIDGAIARVVKRMSGRDFMRLGKWMHEFTDKETPLWALLENPNTGELYTSQAQWIVVRLRSQRATAFYARKLYRQLKDKLPVEVMDTAEPGVLKIMGERLPSSALESPAIQQKAAISSPAEFHAEMKSLYPDHFKDDDVVWKLHPTESQAMLYDRVIGKVQEFYQRTAGESMSRESALEHILRGAEEVVDETPVTHVTSHT